MLPQRANFSSSSRTKAEQPPSRFLSQPVPSRIPQQQYQQSPEAQANLQRLAQQANNEAQTRPQAGASPNEPYHMNVYCHKHNTHITFTEPSRDPIISYSCGNIGLRGAQRGTFDAAYQLASYTFRKIAEKNWKIGGKKAPGTPITLNDPKVRDRGIEVVLRGYGNGREAFTKAILGSEGRIIKGLIKRVTDGTRLKFGGVRSRATRRLG
ncbi:hypothetical protein PMZ80_001111 [Knufia obscura]|uniref:Ribosomal protein S11 n=2 Tax=Knufia TaxID=430999 RepID=A0AAN8EM85_9EURO|nr:hypothetical protein PMZ80_001111 [Knufia obscura]KAK5958824.1 hypothetical protein OHC33_000667 [Knufia fluminis]